MGERQMSVLRKATEDRGGSAPIIVMGMHRSGTTMVIEALEQLGLFPGDDPNVYREANFFVTVNEWLFAQAGGSWERPIPVRRLVDEDSAREVLREHVQRTVRGRKVSAYLGNKRFRRFRHLDRLPHAWGWKDPRNTFTLRVWLDLFPGARVVHVLRNPIDVARSLMARRREVLEEVRRGLPQHAPIGTRCRTLSGCFALWEEYVREAREGLKTLDDQGLEIRYETFLKDPVTSIEALASFCGLTATPRAIATIVAGVRTDRAFAFKKDPKAVSYAHELTDRLHAFGY
jgi:Sulfotransferase family